MLLPFYDLWRNYMYSTCRINGVKFMYIYDIHGYRLTCTYVKSIYDLFDQRNKKIHVCEDEIIASLRRCAWFNEFPVVNTSVSNLNTLIIKSKRWGVLPILSILHTKLWTSFSLWCFPQYSTWYLMVKSHESEQLVFFSQK